MSHSTGDDNSVVHLSSSAHLRGGAPLTTLGPRRPPLSRWTVDDVQQHVFFVVWVCGIPVHVRYIAELLQHSTVGKSHAGAASSPMNYAAIAQQVILAPVCERGRRVGTTLCAWPTTGAFAPLSTALSFLVPLGIAEATSTAARASAEDEDEEETPTENTDRRRSAATTPNVQPETTVTREVRCTEASGGASVVRAVAVEPDEHFANVMALALYSPADRRVALRAAPASTAAPSHLSEPVDPAWCSRAYWTAVRQGQQWADRFAASDVAEDDTDGGGEKSPANHAAPPSCTLVPPVPASSSVRAERRRRRGDASPAPAPVETVIIDAEEGVEGPLKRNGTSASTVKAAEPVIVVDSDDE
ncbi:hypothetical protein ABB37_07028 [Leptomonas pyrrhocoris]|uniref:Uncharacterized protein n=1 Tax=Leptomonas pyrrhocoris TaxID=157538 RepID=A0A0N1J4L3_LEPPY|nr:hypothetical protein ABB37_07028 [Leptomonas pyrrhocoris]XP_015656140.1 hypothetical protein ABB37_07028 [Leptomonas pyrrhocoris]KPA77700.1 hypothetical protein ABB37_07028 [Leptomonas pyrrhocoris]KPA77701.1 hypothetical protein ABB37_07028 [Leptomonas pyrrhocoris]|eukprot:XP_015656139.1 hypothetical protein ABB37_07028 [Leptomonas pyrrhocoris]